MVTRLGSVNIGSDFRNKVGRLFEPVDNPTIPPSVLANLRQVAPLGPARRFDQALDL